MNIMVNTKTRKAKMQNGATMVEYVIMVAFIAMIAFAAVGVFGQKTNALFQNAVNNYPSGG